MRFLAFALLLGYMEEMKGKSHMSGGKEESEVVKEVSYPPSVEEILRKQPMSMFNNPLRDDRDKGLKQLAIGESPSGDPFIPLNPVNSLAL